MSLAETIWLSFGLLGQAMFSMRFLVQWIASERAQASIVPLAFWYFSLAGGASLFAYALYRADPVFILGQGTGLVIYGRNLYLIHRAPKSASPAAAASAAAPPSPG